MKTTDAIDAFIVSTRARRPSPRYIEKLRYALGFLARAHADLPTTTEALDEFFADHADRLKANGEPISDETHVEIWACVKRLYRWLAARQALPHDPAAPIHKPRRRAKEPRILSEFDMHQILDANQRHPREYALLCVMIDTMARLGEVAALKWEHIEATGPTAHFPSTGKQGARSAPLNPDTLTALRQAAPPARSAYIWRKTFDLPLSKAGVKMAFRKALARAGYVGNPHIMRHSAATAYIRNGGDQFHLMRIGGWSSLKAVQLYVHLAASDVRDQHAKYSTMAKRAAQGGHQLTLLQEQSA
jgi:integrase/recombinase XerD